VLIWTTDRGGEWILRAGQAARVGRVGLNANSYLTEPLGGGECGFAIVRPMWTTLTSGRNAPLGSKKMQIGIVGLGRVGGNISRRLMRGGHQCVVFDANKKVRESLGKGAPWSLRRWRSS
jgi:lactate dehydrogenase-like 2-hydroxyacid dehydrogenase